MCTADDEGNMVSLIQSNYRGMGSGISVPGLGFMFQDRGQLFTLEPGHANVYAPGKRPFHTIIPGFVMHDNKPWLAFGVMGGRHAAAGTGAGVDEHGLISASTCRRPGTPPRWQHEGNNDPTGSTLTEGGAAVNPNTTGFVDLESGVPYEVARELRKKGHDIRFDLGGYGGYQAIQVQDHDGVRVYAGASESRKDGQAAGY